MTERSPLTSPSQSHRSAVAESHSCIEGLFRFLVNGVEPPSSSPHLVRAASDMPHDVRQDINEPQPSIASALAA